MKKKSLLNLVLVLIIAVSSVSNVFAWSGSDWELAYWGEHQLWNEPTNGYNVPTHVSFSEYTNMGQSITVTVVGNGVAYPECADLTDKDLVARVIYGEICNVSFKENNAYAIAQTIKNRMGTTKTARQVVTAQWQYGPAFDGNSRFRDPSLDNDPNTWAVCVMLAGQLVTKNTLPISQSGSTNIGTRQFVYDTQSGMPFYIYSGGTYTQCTSSNVTNANRYKTGSTYNTITTSVIKIGYCCYFNY